MNRTKKPILLRKTFNGCVECVSHSRNTRGYTMFEHNGKHTLLTRFIYSAMFGEIPKGMMILHSCDNTACVNPQHLRAGTHQDNMDDKVKRDRQKKGEEHYKVKLTEAQVREIRKLQSTGITSRELATKYGVTRSAIKCIWYRSSWKHIKD